MIAGTLTYNTKMDTNGIQKGLGTIKSIVAGLGIDRLLSSAFNMITSSLDSAIDRVDILNNFPRVMSNMGIDAKESSEAIEDLAERLKEIPTTMDDAVLSVERFTSKNGDVKKSVEIFDAVNNAILAGGASTQIQTSALEQLSQAYSKGKPDMMEWRTIQMAMPAQLNQVAKAMGKTTDELGEDLRSGKVSMNDFIDTFIRLNKEGIDGFQSFEQQAKNSTGGIKTSITNAKTAIVRGVANIVTSINEGLKSAGLRGIGDIFSNLGKIAEKALNGIGELVKKVIPPIIDYIKGRIEAIKKFFGEIDFQSLWNSLQKGFEVLKKFLINVLKPIHEFIQNNIFPIIKKLIKELTQKISTINWEKLQKTLKNLEPVITGVVAGFLAFKTVSTIISVISAVKTAFTSLMTSISTMALKGVMTGWIGITITAITALIFAIRSFTKESRENFQKAEAELESRLSSMSNAFKEYGQQIESAKGYMDGFNTRLFQTEAEQQKLEDDLRDIQNSITEITTKASEERRSLTDAEIQKLDEYFEKLQELRQKQIAIQQQISEAIVMQAQTDLSNFDGNFDQYQEKAANWIKTGQTQRDETINQINQYATEQIAILNNMYSEEERLTNETYKKQYNNIIQNRDNMIAVENEKYQKIVELAQKGFDQEVSINKESIDSLYENSLKRQRIVEQLDKLSDGMLFKGAQRAADEIKQKEELKNKLEKIDKEITDNMTDEQAKQIGVWAKNLEETKKAGGEISLENQQIAQKIIASYSSMSAETQEKFKDTMEALKTIVDSNTPPLKTKTQNMVDEVLKPFKSFKSDGEEAGKNLIAGLNLSLDQYKGSLISKVGALASDVIKRFKSGLQEASPSKATYEMGLYFLQGFDNGLDREKSKTLNTIDQLGDDIINRMSNAVDLESSKINAKAMLTSNINRAIVVNASFDGSVELDNRKVGRIIAPEVSRAIKAGGLA